MKNLEKKAIKQLRGVKSFVLSRQFIPVLKGTLAYILVFVLVFLKRFDGLSKYPFAYSSMIIGAIASFPGKSPAVLALSGVTLGCGGFVILAKLNPWPVAQGVVFAVLVYGAALVKSRGARWFGFSLLFVLQSFNGVYTSYMLGSAFKPSYLVAYYAAYLWGIAIALVVNWLVLPISSEKELRQTLVTSLEHVGTFAHLLAKAYTLEITDEEQRVREHLNQTIRADFGYLSEKIEGTTIEINYSRFSLNDYQCFVAKTRGLQQALITAHSSLMGVEREDMELFKERFLPSTLVAFGKLRRAIDLTIRELGDELGSRPMIIPMTQASYNEYMDLERRSLSATLNEPTSSSSDGHLLEEQLSNQLARVSERLTSEVEAATRAASPVSASPRAAPPEDGPEKTATVHPMSSNTTAGVSHDNTRGSAQPKTECGMQRLRRESDVFTRSQHELLQEALIGGQIRGARDGELKLHQPMASLRETFGADPILAAVDASVDAAESTMRQRSTSDGMDSSSKAESGKHVEKSEDTEDDEKVLMDGHSLIRVWGFLFALDQFVSQLENLWMRVHQPGVRQKKRFHIHLFEAIHRPHLRSRETDEDGDLRLAEALALLEKRPYKAVKPNIWQRIDVIQHAIQSPTSFYALKTAAATSAFATLIYATQPRPWFINYALSSGLLTIVVALTPTLGQSILTFIAQIAGSGIGYLWGLAVLEMFRDVGGYTFNPFGIICMILPYALIMQYVLYQKPAYFVVALLGMNGTGVLVVTEWVAVEYLHRPQFDSPAVRTGKALTALAVALGIVAIFQLFIFRNPARRTLRKTVAALTYDMLSYAVLLQAFGLAVLSSSPESRPSKPALVRVERELKHRELKLQSAIINITPLMKFAAAEPQFSTPFKKDVILRIVKSNQLILDRLREARAALGTEEFQRFILTHFTAILAPYRARSTRIVKTELYLIASSIQTKTPLPHYSPLDSLTKRDRAAFVHDCLVLSARFAHTEEGRTPIGTREFMRYMSFILCSTAVYDPIRTMEEASKELFGELESKLV